MSAKKEPTLLHIVGISAVTSVVSSALIVFSYFHMPALMGKQPNMTQSAKGSAKAPKDANFTKYEAVINGFLDTIRKGQIEAAYKETSTTFQKLTTLDDFKTLIAGYQSVQNIPTSACTLTQYSDPYTTTIKGLPDVYTVVQAKCETTENGKIKGFYVEFMNDKGTPRISYLSAYNNPVIHNKN